jgi:hypothetical protein
LQVDCSNAQNLRPSINMTSPIVFCGIEAINTTLTGNTSNIVGVENIQWLRNNEVLPNENSNTLRVNQEGNYQLLASSTTGCSYLSSPISVLQFPVYTVRIANINNEIEATTNREAINYEWFIDNRRIENMSENRLRPTQSGSYSVRVTDRNGCQATSNALVINITSIADDIYEGNIHIFPNPTLGVVFVENERKKIKSIQVFNAFGKYLNTQKINMFTNTHYQIDLNKEAAGLYFIEIMTQKGRIIKRVVKE